MGEIPRRNTREVCLAIDAGLVKPEGRSSAAVYYSYAYFAANVCTWTDLCPHAQSITESGWLFDCKGGDFPSGMEEQVSSFPVVRDLEETSLPLSHIYEGFLFIQSYKS